MVKKGGSILIIILLILSPFCFSSFVVNAAPAIGSTTVTLEAMADAYVDSSNPETNYGSVGSLYVSENSEQDFTYVMFDLSSLPPGATIIYVELRMYLSSTGGDLYAMPADRIGAYYCSDNSWTENGITWNNKPNFNSEPTATWSFGMMYTIDTYKTWDVTEDARNAFPSGILTEVLKFSSKTGDGYAVFDSREDNSEPELEIEYSTEPVAEVHLESRQDTGATNNLGLTTIADNTFSFPSDVDVVAGNYPVTYSGGYTFMRWETSGGVSVSVANAATTTVTVTGDGTLRAIGNVNPLQYSYDCDHSRWGESQQEGNIDAVRFTPLFSGQLLMARFYIDYISSYQSNAFTVHIMDENRYDLITPFEQTPTSEGWFDVDISSYGISVTGGVDFYIGMEWITAYNPQLGDDDTSPSSRSWEWNGTDWQEITYRDFMIRAVVSIENGEIITGPTIIDHLIIADGIDFHVTTESNSTISNCQFNIGDKELLFNVAGTTSSYGFCKVTIPNELLGSPFNVTCDRQPVSEVLSSDNGTHTWLQFTYPQSTNRIEITGTTVIPEFASAIILPIFMFFTLIAVTLAKKIRRKK